MKQTKDLTLCALFTVLFIIGSKIVIPAGVIPLTLQTMMVILAGMLLQSKQIMISYGLFFLMGLIGFPVFANGGGIAYVLQPSFGFLLSFPIAASFLSYTRTKLHVQHFLPAFLLCLLALLLIYTIGCIYMYGILNFYMGATKNMSAIIAMGAIPFILSDTCSIALGCFCALRLSQVPFIHQSLATPHN